MTWEVKHEREEPEKRLSPGSILKNHARVEANDSTMLSSLVLVRSICEIKEEHSVSQVFPLCLFPCKDRTQKSSRCFPLCLLPCIAGMLKLHLSFFFFFFWHTFPIIFLSFDDNRCEILLSIDSFYVIMCVNFNLWRKSNSNIISIPLIIL